jgi:hypothetical protein
MAVIAVMTEIENYSRPEAIRRSSIVQLNTKKPKNDPLATPGGGHFT